MTVFHHRVSALAVLLHVSLSLVAALFSQAPELPARLPGLVTSFKSADGTTARRVDLAIHHKWASPKEFDERCDTTRPVAIQWSGLLETKAQGRYQLHVYVQGKFTLSLNKKPLISGESSNGQWFTGDTLELPFGFHPLELKYSSKQPTGQIGLYWQGPGFELEPINERYLAHASADTANDDFERGRLLTHALRCAACHQSPTNADLMPAPALLAIAGNFKRDWFEDWLTASLTQSTDNKLSKSTDAADDPLLDDQLSRRMPHLALDQQDAADIAEALWSASLPPTKPTAEQSAGDPGLKTKPNKGESKANTEGKDKPAERKEPSADAGRITFNTRGCLACHSLTERGIGVQDPDDDAIYLPHQRLMQLTQQLFDGGDLSEIARKRPDDFFVRWLSDPASINKQHRMPLTELSELEQKDVSLYLATLTGQQANRASAKNAPLSGNAQRGKSLLKQHRCGACHQLPASLSSSLSKTLLTKTKDWDNGCLGIPHAQRDVPGFMLTVGQRRALKAYWTSIDAINESASQQPTEPSKNNVNADLLLAERNCIACHARGAGHGLATRATQLINIERDLAARLPALLPPSLTGVGDKLHEHALRAAIERREELRRPWLEIRMPKYQLGEHERDTIIAQLIDQDRIPDRPERTNTQLADDVVTRAAAGRLVTSEGFGCQSCHQIGKQAPPTVALNARGSNLSMLGDRIRQAWFDRWVRNPVRIVPRMEMPAIQLPVHGVLGNDLNQQIEAVWEMLNTKGFQPPTPAPVRVVRGHNQSGRAEPAHVLTDVLETSSRNYLRPLIFGFENRHNLMFDLERGEFAKWWIGDTARELTRGKSWYWELGGQPLAAQTESLVKLSLLDDSGQKWQASAAQQFAVDFDSLEHSASGVKWNGRVTFASQSQTRIVPVQMNIEPLRERSSRESGLSVELLAELPDNFGLTLELDPLVGPLQKSSGATSSWNAALDTRSTLVFNGPLSTVESAGTSQLISRAIKPGENNRLEMRFVTSWPVDEVAELRPVVSEIKTDTQNSAINSDLLLEPVELKVVPGFSGVRLPLPRDEMPTALAWYKGQLVIASLKGRVCLARDTDADGLPDSWEPLSDDLPAPYGLAAHAGGIDVLAKYGLMRLSEPSIAGVPWKLHTLADGWGYTADYHDWAVGLPQDADGNYYVALPCQQDDRNPSAARLRGTIQKLIPQSPTSQEPRAYRLETFAAGQRFPMGLAFDRTGNLFATDNQGNYNPFNELNHVVRGKRYGFINKLDTKPGFNPPFESPAINLPHPWTRSVNGICFLNTPPTSSTTSRFGPFEGHLIGCEFNGLSLIRMSVEMVDGTMQGAAYPFSRPPEENETTFEGPVACAVAPDGDLFIGSIHDSGWGGGQNTGSIVRLSPNGAWPLGIATVSAISKGLLLEFTGKIDRQAASQTANYVLRSYRRESTPAYGGNDQDEREEQIIQAHVLPGESRIELELGQLRSDSVYELRIGNISGSDRPLFPNEAHYTMKRIPR